jgi:cytochrome c heme-lyase
VNEQAWSQIVKMEKRLHPECVAGPKLVSIRGLSSKLSPKARLYTWLGYEAPFDRHDWIIDRCNQQHRFIIDYYDDVPPEGKVAGLYMDVRPALDSPGAYWDRARAALMRHF